MVTEDHFNAARKIVEFVDEYYQTLSPATKTELHIRIAYEIDKAERRGANTGA